jgi:hypothetical protein
VAHSFPPVKVLKFRVSIPILVLLHCGLENHDIVGSALSTGRFLVVDLIEHRHLLVVGGLVIF